MEARAELRQVRISPRKVGVVLDLIRNKPCDMACLLYTSPSRRDLSTSRMPSSA